jgi:hypothetical protein
MARPHRSLPEPEGFEPRVQVKPGHYGPQYEGATRWVNYGAQVREVMKCAPQRVLEVGIGNGTVAAILRNRGVAVTTFDIDPSLQPDIVGSVHELTKHVPPKSFDVVLCAEVLEHLPFGMLATCCEQLAAVARDNVVIGLPCFPRPRWGARLELRLPRMGLRSLSLSVTPLPLWGGSGEEHYWEVDHRPYPLARVLDAASNALTVTGTERDSLDPKHLLLRCVPKPL